MLLSSGISKAEVADNSDTVLDILKFNDRLQGGGGLGDEVAPQASTAMPASADNVTLQVLSCTLSPAKTLFDSSGFGE